MYFNKPYTHYSRKSLVKVLTAFTLISSLACSTACGTKERTPQIYQFHTDAQSTYLSDSYKNITLYASGKEDLSKPEPIVLPVAKSKTNTIAIFEMDQDSEQWVGDYPVVDGKAEIYNLKLHTDYRYVADPLSSTKTSDAVLFSTDAQAPRNLYVDGITNIRDVGGWQTTDGSYVKQGMLFRSSKFNEDESSTPIITEKGINTLVNELGIKTEIDLRKTENNESGGITVSPLGSSVNYVSIPFSSGGNIILLNKDQFQSLFSVLGNEANYPIVFHCSIGTDRTGLVAFLINGLMGVSKEDLYKDFLFSNFGNIGSMRTSSIIKTYLETVDTAAGDTLSEKIYNYLIDLGVEKADLDNLMHILSENPSAS